MKRLCAAVLAIVIWTGQAPVVRAAEPVYRGPLSARCAILVEAETGRELFAKNPAEKRKIASITKLMTALVAVRSGKDLQEMVTVAPEWTGIEGSSLYLQPGEKLSLETLLYGLLLRSGNDAAAAVAGAVCGDMESFAAKMNETARELGMADSHFANASGLDAEDHYSTARDMAILARACLKEQTLADMTATRSITRGTRTFVNHNKLLWRYEGCIGMKTGYTKSSGRTLVSAARRNGMTLICVTLDAPDDWTDHTALLDWGFASFETRTLPVGTPMGRYPTEGALTPFCPIVSGDRADLCLGPDEVPERELHWDSERITAPAPAGTQVGEAIYRVGGAERARVPLVTAEAVTSATAPEPTLWERLQEFWGNLVSREP